MDDNDQPKSKSEEEKIGDDGEATGERKKGEEKRESQKKFEEY